MSTSRHRSSTPYRDPIAIIQLPILGFEFGFCKVIKQMLLLRLPHFKVNLLKEKADDCTLQRNLRKTANIETLWWIHTPGKMSCWQMNIGISFRGAARSINVSIRRRTFLIKALNEGVEWRMSHAWRGAAECVGCRRSLRKRCSKVQGRQRRFCNAEMQKCSNTKAPRNNRSPHDWP